ncbi:MAG: DNA repair protein RecO [Candidatus Eisenbacteria bacterium]|nr:DNA repair protein RecO [Candidatus Eisenbacteria bacterium]
MAIEKSEALVLRAIKYGETSKILTLLTRDFGLLKAIAKGVRGSRPKFGSALESFACCEIVVYRRRDRDLHLIGSADLIEAHLPLGASLSRYAFASAIVEFIPRVVTGEVSEVGAVPDPVPLSESAALYQEARWAIGLMNLAPLDTLPYVLRAFQLRFVSLLGHGMELHTCLNCGREIGEAGGRGLGPAAGALALSAGQGGLYCVECAHDTSGTVAVSPAALAVLRAYVENDLAVAARQNLQPMVRAEVGRVMEAFLTAQFDGYRGLRSLKLAASVGG